MILKLICFLWGHQIREKLFTGQTFDAGDFYGRQGMYYVWRFNEICPRCGKRIGEKNEQLDKKVSQVSLKGKWKHS